MADKKISYFKIPGENSIYRCLMVDNGFIMGRAEGNNQSVVTLPLSAIAEATATDIRNWFDSAIAEKKDAVKKAIQKYKEERGKCDKALAAINMTVKLDETYKDEIANILRVL